VPVLDSRKNRATIDVKNAWWAVLPKNAAKFCHRSAMLGFAVILAVKSPANLHYVMSPVPFELIRNNNSFRRFPLEVLQCKRMILIICGHISTYKSRCADGTHRSDTGNIRLNWLSG